MNKVFNKYRDRFVETDPDLKLNVKYFAAVALNPFIEHNSSPRGLMTSSHISQTIVLHNPKESMIQTGLEYEFGKYVIGKKIEAPSEVIAVIKRYRTLNIDNVVERVIIFRNLETGVIDCLEIPYHNQYHPYFGFKYVLNDEVDTYTNGDYIEKDTFLAYPPTVKENGGYAFGKDMNVCMMPITETDEDGIIISKSACKKFKFSIFEKRVIEVGEDSFLLNIYGDDKIYKPFPDIGEAINDTGVIAASRKYNNMYGPGLYSKDALREFDPNFDNAVYVRGPGGIVRDIKVYRNPKKKKALPTGTDEMCEDYAEALLAFYKEIIIVYNSINEKHRRTFNKDIEVGNTFNSLLVEAYGITESSDQNSRYKKMYRKEILDLYRIEFTIEYIYDIGIKYKLSNLHGGHTNIY